MGWYMYKLAYIGKVWHTCECIVFESTSESNQKPAFGRWLCLYVLSTLAYQTCIYVRKIRPPLSAKIPK